MKSILQTKQWSEFKKSQGFEIFKIDELFVHKRKLPLKQNFLYLPEVDSQLMTAQNMDQYKKMASDQDSIFARVEFVDQYSENADKIIKSFGFIKAFEEVQPKWRQIIDLKASEDEILSQMKSKGRYNIRLAQKRGVVVDSYSSLDGECKKIIDDFYNLVGTTVDRKGITGRSKQYFIDLIDNFANTDYFKIYLALYEEKPLSGALISFFQNKASYLYGGSSENNREVMAPYLLHWQIIKDAKSAGMTKYDMLGRSKPESKKSNWAGVTQFKEKFGGEGVEILGSYDYVNKTMMYRGFKILERLRRKQG